MVWNVSRDKVRGVKTNNVTGVMRLKTDKVRDVTTDKVKGYHDRQS
jgi:hypothetical protein